MEEPVIRRRRNFRPRAGQPRGTHHDGCQGFNRTLRARARVRRSRDRRAAAVVEFAIVANMMFLLVLTCIEMTRINMVRNLSQDAAYYAARQAMVPGATKQEAIDVAEDMMGSLLTDGVNVHVSDLDNESTEVVVRVEVDLHKVALISPMFFPNPILSTRASIGTERYTGFYRQ